MVRNKFITKSVKTVTLGEKLREVRSERRLSLAEVSRATRIQQKYLERLEEGDYKALPPDVYVRGFLRSYAGYLGLSEQTVLKAYDRERSIQKNIRNEGKEERFFRPIQFSTFAVTPKLIAAVLVIILAGAAFFYIYRQADLFISMPRLSVTEPLDGAASSERVVRIAGISEKDADVTINNQRVVVDPEGKFSENLAIQSGPNLITVRARNRFDKEAEKTIRIEGDFTDEFPAGESGTPLPENGVPAGDNFKVEISTEGKPVWVAVKADGILIFSGTLEPEKRQTFEAKERITVDSEAGSRTFVQVNGQEKKPLSSEVGMVKDMEFKKDNGYPSTSTK